MKNKKCRNYGLKPECNYCDMRGYNIKYKDLNCYVPRSKLEKWATKLK